MKHFKDVIQYLIAYKYYVNNSFMKVYWELVTGPIEGRGTSHEVGSPRLGV